MSLCIDRLPHVLASASLKLSEPQRTLEAAGHDLFCSCPKPARAFEQTQTEAMAWLSAQLMGAISAGGSVGGNACGRDHGKDWFWMKFSLLFPSCNAYCHYRDPIERGSLWDGGSVKLNKASAVSLACSGLILHFPVKPSDPILHLTPSEDCFGCNYILSRWTDYNSNWSHIINHKISQEGKIWEILCLTAQSLQQNFP